MIDQYQQKATFKELCQWTMLPRSSFYYKPSGGKRGMNPSTQTAMIDGTVVPNTQVVDKIRSILSGEFVCYGYHKVTMHLKQEDFYHQPQKGLSTDG